MAKPRGHRRWEALRVELQVERERQAEDRRAARRLEGRRLERPVAEVELPAEGPADAA